MVWLLLLLLCSWGRQSCQVKVCGVGQSVETDTAWASLPTEIVVWLSNAKMPPTHQRCLMWGKITTMCKPHLLQQAGRGHSLPKA